MSDSTPDPKPADKLRAASSAREPVPPSCNRRGGILSAWLLASVIFHALLLGWLIFLSPVRVFDRAKKTPTNVSPARAREVMKDIEKRQAASLAESLKALQKIHAELAGLEKHKREEFKTYAKGATQEDPAQAMAAVLEQQTNSLAALVDGSAKASLFVRTRANAYFDDQADAQKLARDSDDKVAQAQDHVLDLLSMNGDRFAAVLIAEKEAVKLQESAAKALEAAAAARDPARGSRERSEHERLIDHFTYHVRKAERDRVSIPPSLAALTNAVVQAEFAFKTAQTAADQA